MKISNNLFTFIEKKGKFLSFLKAKAKPMKPRKERTLYELQTSLKDFKRRKVESQQIPFNIDPNKNAYEALASGMSKPADVHMAPAPMVKDQKKI